jgi:arylsulfatase A-like enzyme
MSRVEYFVHKFKSRLVTFNIFLFILLTLLLFYIYTYKKDTDGSHYNLILISIDALRADHMGIYGYNKKTTPNIDQWAKTAVIFNNVRTTTPATYPSFASLMTGKTQFDTGVVNNLGIAYGKVLEGSRKLDDKEETLAEIFKSKGYKTAAFVTNGALDAKLTNINQGFDYYLLQNPDENDNSVYESFIDESADWIRNNKNNRFFLWVHLIAPHSPYMPPKQYQCINNKKYCAQIDKEGLISLEKERMSLKECRGEDLPTETIEKFKTLYDGEISWDDEQVGKLFKAINESNIKDKTVIVFYGDHGEGFDHRYYFFHSQVLYDSSLKIPFIIKDPRLDSQKLTFSLTNLDLSSIIQYLLSNSPVNNSLFTDHISKVSNAKKYNIFSNTMLSKYAIQNGDYKYIYSVKDYSCLLNNQLEELYNLKSDPNEEQNLVSDYPELTNSLKETLLSYLKKYSLPQPIEYKKSDSLNNEDHEALDKLKSIGY